MAQAIRTTAQSSFVKFFPDGVTAEYRGLANHALDVGCVLGSAPMAQTDAVAYFEAQVLQAAPGNWYV